MMGDAPHDLRKPAVMVRRYSALQRLVCGCLSLLLAFEPMVVAAQSFGSRTSDRWLPENALPFSPWTYSPTTPTELAAQFKQQLAFTLQDHALFAPNQSAGELLTARALLRVAAPALDSDAAAPLNRINIAQHRALEDSEKTPTNDAASLGGEGADVNVQGTPHAAHEQDRAKASPNYVEDSNLPQILAAVAPKCTSLTASVNGQVVTTVTAGTTVRLQLACSAKRANLSRDYTWGGPGIPATGTGTGQATTLHPNSYNDIVIPNPGVSSTTYTYSGIANNGEVPSAIKKLALAVTSSASLPSIPTGGINYALVSNGGVMSASSTHSAGYAANFMNDGVLSGSAWGSGGGWNDATPNAFPDWIQATLNSTYVVSSVVLVSLQDNFSAGAQPTPTMPFFNYGVTAFTVQALVGGTWQNVATVTGNALVQRVVNFPPVSTSAMRVQIDAALGGYSRVVELQVLGNTPLVNTPPTLSVAAAAAAAIVAPGATLPPISVAVADAEGQALTVSYAPSWQAAVTGSCSAGNCAQASNITAPSSAGVFPMIVTATDSAGAKAQVVVNIVVSASAEGSLKDSGGGVLASPSTSTVGTLAGSVNVGDGGSAGYSIPIQVPPGINGLQPSLSLSYSSQGGNGHLGVGWSLNGFSSISRCPATETTDGARDAINYDFNGKNDIYCLDGQRLIPTAAWSQILVTDRPTGDPTKYPSTINIWTREYRTEIDQYTKIVEYQEWPEFIAGPSRFVAYSKSGQIMDFGARYWILSNGWVQNPDPSNSLGLYPGSPDRFNSIKVWAMDRVRDRSGNQMLINWGGTSGRVIPGFPPVVAETVALRAIAPLAAFPGVEYYPTEILYGGKYEKPWWNANAATSDPWKGRVEFVYSDRDSKDQSRLYDSGGGESLLTKKLDQVFVQSRSQGQAADVMRYKLNYGTSYSALTNRLLLQQVQQCDGPGPTCISPTAFTWSNADTAQNNRNDVTAVDSGLSIAGSETQASLEFAHVADLNGDGASDLVVIDLAATARTSRICLATPGAIQPFANAGSACSTPVSRAGLVTSNGRLIFKPDGSSTVADFNGDGKVDLVIFSKDYSEMTMCPFGTGTNPNDFNYDKCSDYGGQGGVAGPSMKAVFQGDFDGDGLIDFLFYRGKFGDQLGFDLYRSVRNPAARADGQMGYLSAATRLYVNVAHTSVLFDDATIVNKIIVGDFNGDGRADLAVKLTYNTNSANPGDDFSWKIVFSEPTVSGSGVQFFTSSTWQNGPAVPAVDGVLADFNGDGIVDLSYPSSNGSGGYLAGEWVVCSSSGEGTFRRYSSTANPDLSTCGFFPNLIQGGVNAYFLGDYNGDGRTDFARIASDGVRFCYAEGYDVSSTGNIYSSPVPRGDGVNFSCSTANASTFRPFQVSEPKPNFQIDFQDLVTWRKKVRTGDFIGNGRTQMLYVAENKKVGILAPKIAGAVDVITGFTTGLGASTTVTYAPLTDPSVYKNGSSSDSNALSIQSSMYVVKTVQADNGIAGSLFTDYFYEDLRGNSAGRGVLGFGKRRVLEDIGIVTETETTNTCGANCAGWELANRPSKVTKWAPKLDATKVSRTSNALRSSPTNSAASASDVNYPGYCRINQSTMTWGSKTRTGATPESRTIYEVFNTGSTATTWELTNTCEAIVLPTQTTETPLNFTLNSSVVDNFANYGMPLRTTVTSSDGFTKVTENEFYAPSANNISTWIVGKLKSSKVTHSRTGLAETTVRNSAFTYQGVNNVTCTGAVAGQVCSDEIEPAATPAARTTAWLKTTYIYDTFGNRVTTTVADTTSAARSSTVSYVRPATATADATDARFAFSVTNAAGHVEKKTFDERFGLPSTVTGPNGLSVKAEYDSFGRKVRERAYSGAAGGGNIIGDSIIETISCASATLLNDAEVKCFGSLELYAVRVRATGGAESYSYYDKLQREIRKLVRTYAGWNATTVSYDSNGRKSLIAGRIAGDGVDAWLYTKAQYDVLGRATCEATSSTKVNVDTCDVTVAPLAGVARKAVSYAGLSATTTRWTSTNSSATDTTWNSAPNKQSQTVTKNSQSWSTTTTDANAANTAYTYDAVGNLKTVTAPGGYVESFDYDVRGRKTKMVSPDAGSNWRYEYNGFGELTKQTDSRDYVTTNLYDILGRVVLRNEAGASGVFSTKTTFDTCYYGKACKVESATVSSAPADIVAFDTASKTGWTQITTAYDALLRPVHTKTILGNEGDASRKSATTSTAYDALSRMLDVGYPSGYILRNTYGASATTNPVEVLLNIRERSATDTTLGRTHWSLGSLYLDGQSKTTNVGGFTISKTFDALGRIKTISTPTVQNGIYGFDLIGNLTNRSDSLNGIASTETYGYDVLNRVTTRAIGTAASTTIATYDAAGNLLTREGVSGTYTNKTSTHRVDVANGNAYSYDGNGNVTSINAGSTTGTVIKTLNDYTAFNLPTSITSTKDAAGSTGVANTLTYTYGPGHERVIEQSSGTGGRGTTYTFGAYELHTGPATHNATTLSGNVIEQRHILPAGLGIVTLDGAWLPFTAAANTRTNVVPTLAQIRYFFKDHLGSAVTITDGNTTGKQRIKYDVWGTRVQIDKNPAYDVDPYIEERGFTGHEHLDEVGLIHMNGRVYDPTIGRFLQADPIIQDGYDGQNYNRYSYVVNNPLSLTDPSGFSWWSKWRAPILAIAVGALMMFAAPYAFQAMGFAEGGLFTVGTGGIPSLTATGGTVASAASGFAAGGIQGGNLRSAVAGAVGALAMSAALSYFNLPHGAPGTVGEFFGKIAVHGAVGCARSAMAGGSCGKGASAAGFAEFAGNLIGGGPYGAGLETGSPAHMIAQIAFGCAGGELSGGKCSDGAFTAGFNYLVNHVFSKLDVARFYSKPGHHPFAQAWANEFKELISPDALEFSSRQTIGSDIKWEKGHPNRWNNETGHPEYNTKSGRDIFLKYVSDNNITKDNPLTVKQAAELDAILRQHEFNKKVEDYAAQQRRLGKFNFGRSSGGSGQPQN